MSTNKKLKLITIDGLKGVDTQNIYKQIRKFLLQNSNKSLVEVSDVDVGNISDENNILIRKSSVITDIYTDMLENASNKEVQEKYHHKLEKERILSHNHGSVTFFVIPDSPDFYTRQKEYSLSDFDKEYIPSIIAYCKNIPYTTLYSGADIKLIIFNKDDKILNISQKIIDKLQSTYQL